jgi:hypothetical protein
MDIVWYDVFVAQPCSISISRDELFTIQSATLLTMLDAVVNNVPWNIELVSTDLHCVVLRENARNFAGPLFAEAQCLTAQTIFVPAGKYEIIIRFPNGCAESVRARIRVKHAPIKKKSLSAGAVPYSSLSCYH